MQSEQWQGTIVSAQLASNPADDIILSGNRDEVWCVIVDPPFAVYDGTNMELIYFRGILVARQGLLWEVIPAVSPIVGFGLADLADPPDSFFLRRGCTNWQE
jgi:hypothetical protein